MSGIRVVGRVVVHAPSIHVDFHLYAHTACGIRVNWTRVGNSPRGERVNEPVDCMTCLVNVGREQDRMDIWTNPCAEIALPDK